MLGNNIERFSASLLIYDNNFILDVNSGWKLDGKFKHDIYWDSYSKYYVHTIKDNNRYKIYTLQFIGLIIEDYKTKTVYYLDWYELNKKKTLDKLYNLLLNSGLLLDVFQSLKNLGCLRVFINGSHLHIVDSITYKPIVDYNCG